MLSLLLKAPHIIITREYIYSFLYVYSKNIYLNDKIYEGIVIYHGSRYVLLYRYNNKLCLLTEKLKFKKIDKYNYIVPINQSLAIMYYIYQVKLIHNHIKWGYYEK